MKIRYELAIAVTTGIVLGVSLCLVLMKVLTHIAPNL
jgi:hypothetical protein